MVFITCMSRLEQDDKKWPDFGTSRVFGFFERWEEAVEALHSNSCDMFEFLYKFAVIEEMHPGIHPDVERRQFFEWDANNKGFYEINEPAFMSGFSHIALG